MSNLICHSSEAIHLLDFLRLSPWDLGLPLQSRLARDLPVSIASAPILQARSPWPAFYLDLRFARQML